MTYTHELLEQIKELLRTSKLTHVEIGRATGVPPTYVGAFAIAWGLRRPVGRRLKWKPRELVEPEN